MLILYLTVKLSFFQSFFTLYFPRTLFPLKEITLVFRIRSGFVFFLSFDFHLIKLFENVNRFVYSLTCKVAVYNNINRSFDEYLTLLTDETEYRLKCSKVERK